ncbi:DUF397 domain-containing protein [Streptomyces sp. NPDC004959]|uniref:DUF397 domain-containing protein n=1 Tax=unclassified Streptomyces TaxID=2593676 RepID=UPI0004CC2E21|nr:DUF397 domain-containing protein [Streptomyces sp. NRRL F-5630]
MSEHYISNTSLRSGWRKSSYSGTNGSSCLEVFDAHPAGVPVRDSKSPQGPALLLSAPSWSVFVAAVKRA